MARIKAASRRLPLTPKRTKANKRWTPEENTLLKQMVHQGADWTTIAAAFKRSFSSVQNQFQKLAKQTPADFRTPVVANHPLPVDRIANDPACAITSPAAVALTQHIFERIRTDSALAGKRHRQRCRPEVRRAIGTVVERTLKLKDSRPGSGWVKISIGQIRASRFGVDVGVFRNLLGALERAGYLERLVGYALIPISEPGAQSGRIIRVKATARLIKACAAFGVLRENIRDHFLAPDCSQGS
jgi:hypothetical protein